MIELNNVNFKYNSSRNDNDFSLCDVNINIAKGEFISIIGPNGSGKSTLLKIIAGLLKPHSGYIKYNSKPLSEYKPKQLAKLIGYVPQNTSSVYPFSVYEIVMMGRTPHLNFSGYEKKDDKEIVKKALEYVGISELRNKGINEVSGGEAQRAFIARALVQQPEIVLLDEPNAHLDIRHQVAIFDLLKSFNIDKELTIIAVSHDLNLAGHYGRRGLLLNGGKVISDDSIKNILSEKNIYNNFGVNSKVNFNKLTGEISVTIVPH